MTPDELIRQRMAEAGHSIASLAEATGIPRVTLGRKIAQPDALTLHQLRLIADALGVDWIDLAAGRAA